MDAVLEEVDGLAFRELVSQGRPLVVLFGSPSCEPCHALEPIVAGAAAAHPGLRAVRVDVERHLDIGRRYRIWALPTLMQFSRGEHARIRARDAAGLDAAMQRLLAHAVSRSAEGPASAPPVPAAGGEGVRPLSELHRGLAPFGRDIEAAGIPDCLSASGDALEGLICRIGVKLAAGVRVGCGQVLTNRHVAEQLQRTAQAPAEPAPAEPATPALRCRAVPPGPPAGALVMPWSIGRDADWALLDEADASVCAMPRLRSAATLALGDMLWVVGGSDGERDLVSVGRLRTLKGVNGVLGDCDVRPGMSGAAIIDLEGRVVGLFSTQFGWPGRRAMFVTIDAIAAGIEACRVSDPGLPRLRFEPVEPAAGAGGARSGSAP